MNPRSDLKSAFRKNFLGIAAISAMAAISVVYTPVNAQVHPLHKNDKPSHLMFEGDTVRVAEILQNNAPAQYNIPGLPRFAIFGKEGKFYLGIGGAIKATAGFDFGDPISNPNSFVTSSLPMDNAPGNGGKFQVSAQQSSLFVNFVALPGSDNQVGAFVAVNFVDDNYALNLKQAYLTFRGIKAGYTYGLFCDVAAGVPTIDYQGPCSATSVQNGVIDYEHSFGKEHRWKAGVGLEMPQTSVTVASQTATVSQRMPDIPAFLQYSWAKGDGWIRGAVMVRNLFYRDLTTGKNVDKVGWGINISGHSPLAGALSASWQGVYGKGIASYFQDLNGKGMDLMPDNDRPGVLNTVKAWGGYFGLQYSFSPKVFCSATYSHVRTYAGCYNDAASPAGGWGGQYKYAQYAVANVFWNITPILQTGLEYLYGRRVNYDGQQAHDNRIQTCIQLSF